VFNVGAASCGAYGNPAGVCEAMARWGTMELAELAAPAAALARDGVALNEQQAYVFSLLTGILRSTPEAAAIFAPEGRVLREGERFRSPELGDAIELLGTEGAEPFYTGAIAEAVVEWLAPRGGLLTREDLADYAAVARAPVSARYRGRCVLANPPPSAGGVLIALALALLDRRAGAGPPAALDVVEVMERVQDERTPEFVAGLADEGFADGFLASRLGSTTHISVLDADGRACSVTCTNGEGSGVLVPGTGMHLNNMMGEEDLNPLGFHAYPPGRRLPSMMAPTVVLAPGDGGVELVLGSAGSNRIRSAILQTIVGVVDHGLAAQAAVDAPRLHFEDGVVYAEPGIDVDALRAAGRDVAPFRAPNLFFGGVQAVERDAVSGALSGAGDPRRGGAVASA
jgi:gamma-glutamyltranspeptidase/glutathione hydrolase